MAVFFSVLVVFLLLVINEIWGRRVVTHGEFSRKFAHITVGSFVAFWPFFLTWDEIRLLSVAFLVVVFISKQLKLFQAIHSVQRPTWGELLFAASVGIISFLTEDKWIYTTALLQMSLADGFAAVIGTKFGRKQRYAVAGYAKSVIGTLTFFVVSVAILVMYKHTPGASIDWPGILGIAMLASLVENLAVRGLDNLLVPLLVAALLIYA